MGENNVIENQELNETKEQKQMTFDEMLKLDGFQAEFDRRLGQALITRETALKQEHEKVIADRDKDLSKLQNQLKGFEGTEQAFKDLQQKYDDDRKLADEQLKKQSYEFAIKELSNELKFSSNSAKNYFINQVLEKQLTTDDNGKVLGFNDFVQSYKEQDPDSFVVEVPKEEQSESKAVPTFTKESQGATIESNPFGFLSKIPQINI